MATHPVQQVTRTGAAHTYAVPEAGGDRYSADDLAVIHVRNTSGVPVTVTPNSQALCDTGLDHDTPPNVVVAGAERYFGPFPRRRYADGTGFVNFTTSTQAAGITLAVLKA